MKRASILAIGTEITDGQILNRNAVWISERLGELGIQVVAHVSVPDDETLIRDALTERTLRSDLVVVTGGLGPTTDDFTRDVLSSWSGRPLLFRESSWAKIVSRLSDRGIEVAESNRKQCYFPRDSTILENSVGTADGFRFRHSFQGTPDTEILVLPGPPREGIHIWDQWVDPWLKDTFPEEKVTDLERWHCLGKSESSLGEIVEAALKDFDVTTGYRASVPYVEVKIWIPRSYSPEKKLALIAKLDSTLAPYCVARNDETLIAGFIEKLKSIPGEERMTLLDLGTSGRLTERLVSSLRTEAGKPLRSRLEILTRMPASDTQVTTASELPETSNEWLFFLFPNGEVATVGPAGKRHEALPNPYPNPSMAERLSGYRAEMALKVWSEMLAVDKTNP